MNIQGQKDYEAFLATTQESRNVVKKAINALNKGDNANFVACFSDDLVFWMPGSTPLSGMTKGIHEFINLFSTVAASLKVMVTLEVTNFIACGEWVVTESKGHGVNKRDEDYDNTYCHIWRIQNGKIVKFVEYNDTDLIMKKLCD